MDDFLTVAEVAGLLKLNQQTIRNWIDAGTLPAVRVGRRVRIRREDLEAMVRPTGTTRPSGAASEPPTDAQASWDGDVLQVPVVPGT